MRVGAGGWGEGVQGNSIVATPFIHKPNIALKKLSLLIFFK